MIRLLLLLALVFNTPQALAEEYPARSVRFVVGFGVAHFISRMSRYVTLHPNDVIWLGCDGPTEPALQPGDLLEVVNDAIGVLASRVRREE